MRVAPVALGILVVCAGSGRAAGEEAYVGAAMGPGAGMRGGLDDLFQTRQASGRIALGIERGGWALEAVFFGTDLELRPIPSDPRYETGWPGETHSLLSLGLDIVRFARIIDGLDLYARGGISYTWLVATTEPAVSSLPGGAGFEPTDFRGRGLQYGCGARYLLRLPTGVGTALVAGVFADVGRQTMWLHRTGKDVEATLDMFVIGPIVGGHW